MIDLSRKGDPGWKSYFALVAQIDNTPWGGEIIHRFFDSSVGEFIDVAGGFLAMVTAERLSGRA